ncbi:unnamed protein product [Owenia fusiformis]|uniref:Sodefrin-like factor n=1 Tax=Owenia fusiformis TaxID=6347 RepID=A0A8S4NRK6_OWEFU|nr:unnamed protein product [Owenia fusiformis]
MSNNMLLFFILGYIVIGATEGLQCYSCTYAIGQDKACVIDPANVTTANIANCKNETTSCYSYRQFQKGDGTLRTFGRGCNDAPYKEQCSGDEDRLFQTCYWICNQGNLCNYRNRDLGTGTPSIPSATATPTKPSNVGTVSYGSTSLLALGMMLSYVAFVVSTD